MGWGQRLLICARSLELWIKNEQTMFPEGREGIRCANNPYHPSVRR
jgi:hypothetical protein